MKIGILTFHWATNYGAVLQTFALQEFLRSAGHNVVIIDYKPKIYDYNLKNLILVHRLKGYKKYWKDSNKEIAIDRFRKRHLLLSSRCYRTSEISDLAKSLDVIISGSDQVLNPFFLKNGEGRAIVSPAYYLGFNFEGKRIGYAVSFGCTEFPKEMTQTAIPFLRNFDSISVRESSGISILSTLGISDAVLVPDPTILIESDAYSKLADSSSKLNSEVGTYAFFIRNVKERQQALSEINQDVKWFDAESGILVEDWLHNIKHASFVMTDSFHCVVMCLKMHTPFCIITEQKGVVGMNDRFYTLLGAVGLESRILYKDKISQSRDYISKAIDWESVDEKLSTFKEKGVSFLNTLI